VSVVVAILAVLVNLVRQPGSAVDNLWAEDGRIFLTQAWQHPVWDTAVDPYNGYLHLFPRLAAALAAALPVGAAAAAMAVAGAIAAAIAAVAVIVGSEGHLRSLPARAGLGVAVGLFPAAGFEIAANAANAHWYLMAATFWMLLWTPRTRLGAAVSTGLVFLTATSDPLTALLAPLGLVRLVAGGRGSRVVIAGLVAGLAAQVPAVLTQSLQPPVGRPTASAVTGAYLRRIVGGAGAGFSADHDAGRAAVTASVALLAGLTVLAVLVARRRGRTAVLLAACVVWSMVMFAVPVALRWSPIYLDRSHPTLGTRYSLVPWLLVLVVGAAAVDAVAQRWRVAGALVGLAWIAAVVAVCVPSLGEGTARAPSYSAQLPHAHRVCDLLPGPATMRLAASPGPSWDLVLPCARLRNSR